MKVKSFQGGYDKNLCYLIWCEETNIAGIIDPSVFPEDIIDFVENNNLKINKILITHTHHDHIQYLDEIHDKYSEADIYISKETTFQDKEYIGLEHNDVISIGENLVHALFTPGHYNDSICYWCKDTNFLFTGDTVFVGRTGRTIGFGSDIEKLYHSIYNIILKLPIYTKIFPGHHYGYTEIITIRDNIKYSDFFSCSSFGEFVLVMKNFEKNRKK